MLKKYSERKTARDRFSFSEFLVFRDILQFVDVAQFLANFACGLTRFGAFSS